MRVSYKRLWIQLIEHDMNKGDLAKKAQIGTKAVAKMGRSEEVSLHVLMKICSCLGCNIEDIIEFVPDDADKKAG